MIVTKDILKVAIVVIEETVIVAKEIVEVVIVGQIRV